MCPFLWSDFMWNFRRSHLLNQSSHWRHLEREQPGKLMRPAFMCHLGLLNDLGEAIVGKRRLRVGQACWLHVTETWSCTWRDAICVIADSRASTKGWAWQTSDFYISVAKNFLYLKDAIFHENMNSWLLILEDLWDKHLILPCIFLTSIWILTSAFSNLW